MTKNGRDAGNLACGAGRPACRPGKPACGPGKPACGLVPIDAKTWDKGGRDLVAGRLAFHMDAAETCLREGIDHFQQVGRLLRGVKAALPEGQFEDFLDGIKRPGWSRTSLYRAMRLADALESRPQLKRLTTSIGKIEAVIELRSDELDQLIKDDQVGDLKRDEIATMPRRELIAKVHKLGKKVAKGEQQVAESDQRIEQLEKELDQLRGGTQPQVPVLLAADRAILALNNFATTADRLSDQQLKKMCAGSGVDGAEVWRNTVSALREAFENIMPKLARLGVSAYRSKPGSHRPGKPSDY